VAKQESWQDRERREKREAEERMTSVRGLLRRIGVETVEAHYDGAGDDGWVNKVVFHPLPPAAVPEGIQEVIAEFAVTRLPPGWEINAGSSGRVSVDVNSGVAALDHHWNTDDEAES
jgi:hypothetical protein